MDLKHIPTPVKGNSLDLEIILFQAILTNVIFYIILSYCIAINKRDGIFKYNKNTSLHNIVINRA